MHNTHKIQETKALPSAGFVTPIVAIKGLQNYVLDCKVPAISRLPPTPVANVIFNFTCAKKLELSNVNARKYFMFEQVLTYFPSGKKCAIKLL